MGGKNNQIGSNEPAIHRILDANLDRAREGLRIIEEWCRFALNNSEWAEECKNMRQELASWHSPELRAARDTIGDVGTELSHLGEETRQDIKQLLQANVCRVEEALRVLEEYGKLYNQEMAKACKQMRYRVYTIENGLLAYEHGRQLDNSFLYLITTPSENVLAIVEAALQGGLTLVQYRDKNSDDLLRLTYAYKLRELCHRYDALLIVNDRVDLALAIDADGVHLGQQDFPVGLARDILGKKKIIGCSTTNPDEMERAINDGADYIGVGPVYATPTKQGKTPAGLEYVRYAAENCTIPWYAIGGIDAKNINEVLSAGADRVAIVRGIMQAEQPTLVTQYLLSQLMKKQTIRRVEARKVS
jgi:thiamine-phosphate pyrophosphorylase